MGAIKGKAGGWKTRADNRHGECEAGEAEWPGRDPSGMREEQEHVPTWVPGRDGDAKEQSQCDKHIQNSGGWRGDQEAAIRTP